MRKVEIFDSTLRDGEQAPGFSMNLSEKLSMARILAQLGADVIEAGFAACSQGDFACVKAVADEIKGVSVASLCRCTEKDAEIAWNAIKNAEKPLLNIFIATSDLHMKEKLDMTREQVLERVAATVSYAKTLCPNIEFSAEDATRSDRNFLAQVLKTAVANGASVVNMADTVGYAQPWEIEELVAFMKKELADSNPHKLSVHCHNDLGLATANTLAAIKAGADRVDVTVNGIGERAGNAALEEVVMALKTRPDLYGAETSVNAKMLFPASRKLTMLTGCKVQPNKAVVGKNAFAHEAGIHQHGVMKNPTRTRSSTLRTSVRRPGGSFSESIREGTRCSTGSPNSVSRSLPKSRWRRFSRSSRYSRRRKRLSGTETSRRSSEARCLGSRRSTSSTST